MPSVHLNTFTKIMGIILMLLIPILILYGVSNRTSVTVVTGEVEKSMYKDLSFFASKIDETASQLSKSALLVIEDSNVRRLEFLEISTLYEQTNEKLRIGEKLRLLGASSAWDSTISVYAPATDSFVSTNPSLDYNQTYVDANFSRDWRYAAKVDPYYRGLPRIIRYLTEPYESTVDKAGLIVEISFPVNDLVKSLDRYKEGGQNDPFILDREGRIYASSTQNVSAQQEILRAIRPERLTEMNLTRLSLSGGQYVVSAVWMPSLEMYLIDYLPIAEVVRPITAGSYLFYGSIFFLLIGSTIAAYVLYINVQVPMRELILGVRKLTRGEYPKLKVFHPNNEFHFLLVSFNDMAKRIEDLIQNVYLETIRSRDANLKQLQSQINPHFLYNCFTLIRSLARLGHKESVMELSLHLSKYYRYTTRIERQTAELREEMDLVASYLAIQAMNVQDLRVELAIPEPMNNLEVPRLILQPLVENAVVHGIEPAGEGWVKVSGMQDDRYNRILVTDNGVGVTPEKLAQLQQEIAMPPTEEHGCALWNTRQRMLLQFGPEAGLRIGRREEGGMVAELYWPKTAT